MERSRLTRDGTAKPVSRDRILRHARGQENIHFPYSADHEQDWQPYPVDPYSAIICDDQHTYIHKERTGSGAGLESGVGTETVTGTWTVKGTGTERERERGWKRMKERRTGPRGRGGNGDGDGGGDP